MTSFLYLIISAVVVTVVTSHEIVECSDTSVPIKFSTVCMGGCLTRYGSKPLIA